MMRGFMLGISSSIILGLTGAAVMKHWPAAQCQQPAKVVEQKAEPCPDYSIWMERTEIIHCIRTIYRY